MRYRSLSGAMKERFGTKVYRLALTTGATCPNRDGILGYGGCIFCSEGGSGEFAAPLLPVKEQIRQAKKRVSAKFSPSIPEEERKYIAYFQSFTNTYGDEDALLSMFREAAAEPGICAVAIGTRPDCLSEKMISGLSELNKEVPVWVELGLQAGLEVIVHIILGLPGETRERMLETVRYVGDFVPRLDGIKISLLYVLRGTDLADLYAAGQVPEMTLEEYAALIVDCLRILPEDMTVHRLTGDGPKKLLLSPLWSGDKKRVLNTLNRAIREAER